MRRPHSIAIVACGLAGIAVLAGCDDSQSPPTEQAIVFQHVEFPDTVLAFQPWTLHAFVLLGPNLCWNLERAGIDQQGSELVLSGRSRFSSTMGGACAQALAEEWIALTGPLLPAGDYTIEAGGLRDTLFVRPAAGLARWRLMADGQIWSYAATWRFTSAAYRQYQVANPEAVPMAGNVRLYGGVLGREADFVVIRRLEYPTSRRLGQPVSVPIEDVPQESGRIYYANWCVLPEDVVSTGTELLAGLLAGGIDVRRAWLPEYCSPCECVSCVAGIVLELGAPSSAVASHGFRPEIGPWAFNCGVQSMWRFEVTD